jgi:PAS domain S-box-containing protein
LAHPIIDERIQRLLALLMQQEQGYAVIPMDTEGVVLAWIGAAETIFGLTADETVGRSLAQIFTPDDRKKHMDRYELKLAAAAGMAEDDRWHLRKDGVRFWASGAVLAIKEADKLVGFVKLVRDRTDLRAQVDSLEAELVGLRETRERTHLFLKTLGHELRNPLAPLSNATHIIGRVSDDTRVTGALQIISRQIAALTRLADDLMDVSRLESGRMALDVKSVDLRPLLQDAVDSSQKEAQAKQLQLQAVLPQARLVAEVDEGRFQRVVLNLIGNAIKYTPAGGHVWVKATQDGRDILVRVEDTGIGIAPEMLPRIFELFTRSSTAADMVPTGLGVGLAVVKEIVELHGGNVQARSAGVGKGSEFTVRVPMPRDA